jgi:hypothetical protein
VAEGDSAGNLGGIVTVKNSILCPNALTNTNVFGSIVDAGNNIDSDSQNSLTNSTSLNGTNPDLAPLGNYGGPTPTMALLPDSPAIDAADRMDFPATDQRGHPRPYGSAPDIGAFEYSPPNMLILGAYANGQLHLAFAGTNGQNYRIQTSVDLKLWNSASTNTLGVTGYQDKIFTTTNLPGLFFRAVSP